MWDWGDEISDWLGPYGSGEIIEVPHIWNALGEFEIRVKAKDVRGKESGWSDIILINIVAMPMIEIGDITGGFGVNTVIRNIGAAKATDVEWTIKLDGFVLFGKEKTGTFEEILPGSGLSAKTGLVFGLGNIKITVTVDEAEKTADALLIGPFVLNVVE